jgi:hypothetical protein
MLLADTVRHLVNLDHSVIVTADDVANLYWTSPPDAWHLEEYPGIMPPFDNMWIEFHAPPFGGDDGDFTKSWPRNKPSRWGALICTAECKQRELLKALSPDDDAIFDPRQLELDADQTKWSVAVRLYIKGRTIPPFEAMTRTFALDKEGRVVVYHEDGQLFYLGTHNKGEELPEEVDGHGDLYTATERYFETIFLAISFMHCRNVSLRDGVPSSIENTLRRTKGKPPLLTYKTLVIDHMKEVLRSEGGMTEGGSLKRAIHICRGHFAHYTEQNPLFGRLTGTFWVPQHVRGSTKRGIVNKTYKVR